MINDVLPSAMADGAGSSQSSDSPTAAADAPPVHPAGAPALAGAAAVLQDLADGCEPLTFARIAKLRCMSRNGKARAVAFVHRAADSSKAHPLEFAVISGVRMSTERACLRWLARNSGARPSASVNWTPDRLRREHRAAEKALQADGF